MAFIAFPLFLLATSFSDGGGIPQVCLFSKFGVGRIQIVETE